MTRTTRAARLGPALLLAMLLVQSTARADDPAAPRPVPIEAVPVAFPTTPAGRTLAYILDALAGKEDPSAAPERFSASFLKAVPPEKLTPVLRTIRAQTGGGMHLVKIAEGATDSKLVAIIRAEKGPPLKVIIGLDADGKIAALLFQPAAEEDVLPIASWDDLDGRFAAMEAAKDGAKEGVKEGTKGSVTVSFGVYSLAAAADGGRGSLRPTPVHVYHDESRLAVGSTFKLYVLGALGELIKDGGAAWEEKLAIRDEDKSFPSGVMQNLPAGETFPLSEFAARMISVSDNTATDHLIRRVGRERIEKYMARLHGEPERNTPFLTTREMFQLKLGPDRTLAARYAEAGLAERRAMLVEGGAVAASEPALLLAAAWKAPFEIERVEWFASAKECCRVMADLERLGGQDGMGPLKAALRMNPGEPLDRAAWTDVAYKGGSEPGVLNMTWMLTRADGARFVLSLGVNDTVHEVDLGKTVGLARRVIDFLAGQR